MKIVAISDTHNYTNGDFNVPDGDLLIHAGDATFNGYSKEIEKFGQWFRKLPHKHKIFVPGNHDTLFEDSEGAALTAFFGEPSYRVRSREGVTVLINDFMIVDGLKIYGHSWTPYFGGWAYNVRDSREMSHLLSGVPSDTDIVISHGPPYGVGDVNIKGENCGCKVLRKKISSIEPRYVFCGHIHEGYGGYRFGNIEVFNVSTCNLRYQPINPAVELEV